MPLTQIEALPQGLLTVSARELEQVLPEPTLLHLPGRAEPPLFVSVLLHGNETTGFSAVQALLKHYQNKPLPRALSVFFGNVSAASQGMRRLNGQPDYNRIWPGTSLATCIETRMAQAVVRVMAERGIFASIDIHNNTGLNPHYACINRLAPDYQQLAALFSRLVIYFIRPRGVQSAALAELGPAVTLECGKPGQVSGIQHTLDYLENCLHCPTLSNQALPRRSIQLIHSTAIVSVRRQVDFSFERADAELKLDTRLDRMNFTDIPAGTVFGTVQAGVGMPLYVRNEAGRDVTHDYFGLEGKRLLCTRPLLPSMLTLDERVIRQDCFCYLMENLTG